MVFARAAGWSRFQRMLLQRSESLLDSRSSRSIAQMRFTVTSSAGAVWRQLRPSIHEVEHIRSTTHLWLMLLLAAQPAFAARTEWSASVSGEFPTAFSPNVARPLPSGGAVVSGTDAQGRMWTLRLGSDLTMERASRFSTFGFAPFAVQATKPTIGTN